MTRVDADAFSAQLRAAGLGGGRRDAPFVREARGLFRLLRLARLNVALLRAGRKLRADVVHANDFDTLPAAWLLARRHSARLVYDAHELYTEQEADPPRIHRGVVATAERFLARRADVVVTVNDAIAEELSRRLRLQRRPLVVHNFPGRADAAPAGDDEAPVRAIYQGALGHGRQLEDLVAAAAAISTGTRIAVRVVGADAGTVRRAAGAHLDVLEPASPDRLVEALADFDVGIVVTRPLTLNDELATPNKLFEYLMAGLAVVVPRLPGVAQLVEAFEVGVTFEPGEPRDLARALDELARDRPRLRRLRENARRAAHERFNAEAERPALAAAWGVA